MPGSAHPYAIGGSPWPGLSKLIEEAGEVLQVAGKLIATGGDAEHWDGTNLRERLEEELADLSAAIGFFIEANPSLDAGRIVDRTFTKYTLFEGWHKPAEAAS